MPPHRFRQRFPAGAGSVRHCARCCTQRCALTGCIYRREEKGVAGPAQPACLRGHSLTRCTRAERRAMSPVPTPALAEGTPACTRQSHAGAVPTVAGWDSQSLCLCSNSPEFISTEGASATVLGLRRNHSTQTDFSPAWPLLAFASRPHGLPVSEISVCVGVSSEGTRALLQQSGCGSGTGLSC